MKLGEVKSGTSLFDKIMKVFSTIVIFTLFLSLLSFSGCTKKHSLSKEEINIIRTNGLNNWNRLNYVEIDDTPEFEKYIDSFIKLRVDDLSEKQIQNLKIRLKDFFLAFNQGKESSYNSFFLPENLNWSPTPQTSARIRAKWESNNEVQSFPPTDEKLFTWYLKDISGNSFYKDFWQAVCLDPLSMKLKLGNDDELPVKYGICSRKEFTINSYQLEAQRIADEIYKKTFWSCSFIDKHFKEKVGALESYKEKNYLCVIDLFCFVKRKSSYPPLPLITQFYWNESGQIWIPRGYLIGYIPGIKAFENFGIVEFF